MKSPKQTDCHKHSGQLLKKERVGYWLPTLGSQALGKGLAIVNWAK